MDCSRIDEALIGYVFGAVDDAERDAVDAHLLACERCLKAFLALKRHIESGEGVASKPPPSAKERLRRELFPASRPSRLARALRPFARPIPLYQGVAAAVAIAALAAIIPRWIHPTAARTRSEVRVDTARQTAASLEIY